jgi:ATP/maltotriose-dependent transcriptional regulator MalT
MDECIERGMLQPQGDYYTFRHELARQTILESIPAQRKIVLHRMTLSALKESPATRNDLARLAHHAEGTKDAAAVLEYALAAGKQASSVSSHREAAAQYARALRYAEILPQDERAQLFENRSYELWLSGQLEDAVNAQQSAYAAWQQLGRLDKAGNCLRFLAQVTMFAGNLDAAKSYIAKALEIVDGFPPGPDLANVYSTKARIHMVFGEDNEALLWGTRAIELAEAQGAADALITALNTVGNVEQLYTPEIGQAKLKRSLALALEYQMYEHVARAYGNLGEGEYDQRRYDHALEYDAMAIEYAEKHDLDIFGFYTKRARAKVYFDQGRWPEAAAEADEVIHSNLVFPMTHADALIVINRVRVREGQPVSPEEIDWLVKYAAGSIVSERCHVAVLFAELAWLQGDLKRCRAEVESIFQTAHQFNFSRELGELAYWMWRAGALIEPPEDVAEPFVTQIAGNWQKAAAIWKQYGCPYEQGMALMDGDEAAQLAALEIFEQLGARPIMEKLKQQMRTQGIRLPRRARPATRKNLFNLTARELEVLGYLVKSLSNSAIAKQLSLSTRTVDHHIASVLQKMDVQSRSEAAALALKDGLISSE